MDKSCWIQKTHLCCKQNSYLVFHTPNIVLANLDCITNSLADNSSKFPDFSNAPLLGYDKINLESSKIRQLYLTLMSEFDKTLVIAFYNSFMEIKLNCDKENMLILNTSSFQNVLSDLTYILIYTLTKCVLEDGSENSVKLVETDFSFKEVRVF